MDRFARVVGISVFVLCSAATAAETGPVSKEPLWFRIVVGEEEPVTVLGYLDESKGTGKGYDVAVVDEDGDGVPEARHGTDFRIFAGDEELRSGTEPTIRFTWRGHAGSVDVHQRGEDDRPEPVLGMTWISATWSLASERGRVEFDGTLWCYTNRESAEKMRPVRIGPPFRFRLAVGRRGPWATLTPQLRGASDFVLSRCWRTTEDGVEEVVPRFELYRDGETVFETDGEYG